MCSNQTTFVQVIRETRFKDGVFCPGCQSQNVVKNGMYKDTQKYHCNSCGRYFNDLTDTIFSHCRIKDKILQYLECMQQSFTLKQSEQAIGVCYVNLFHYRHKITKAFSEDETQLLHQVMCSHIHMDHSNKGQSSDFGRLSYERGYSCTVDFYSREKITVFCIIDEVKNALVFHLPSMNPDCDCFAEMVGKRTMNSTHWITSPGRIYEKYCKKLNLIHRKIYGHGDETSPNVKEAWLELTALQQWLNIFRGVATKYLGNYLKWFRTLRTNLQNRVPKHSQCGPAGMNLLLEIEV